MFNKISNTLAHRRNERIRAKLQKDLALAITDKEKREISKSIVILNSIKGASI